MAWSRGCWDFCTFDTGETISVADVALKGKFSTTHSELDDMVERYLIAYCVFQIYKRESNITDTQVQQLVLTTMEQEIVDSYQELTDDITEIPDIISPDDEWS